ncbi:MAG: AbrB/MazE/SpoVT family DNA-binding domain-containing protein [Candidatus Omnitrophica bacterium]|nr:AbrB/MazE/SpoVT family DNA-binding domain-containing protein [Candidatus Omnitrophota bacterium]
MAKFSGPQVYGAVTVGERGQVVIPAKLRKVFGISPGDKLFVFTKGHEFINLVPSAQFNEFLEHMSQMLEKMKKENIHINK